MYVTDKQTLYPAQLVYLRAGVLYVHAHVLHVNSMYYIDVKGNGTNYHITILPARFHTEREDRY